jgi:hypothetical protein
LTEPTPRASIAAADPSELRRYRVRIQTHTGRVLQRKIITFRGELKAVALACELIHRQLGCEDLSVTADAVFVDDLGLVRRNADGTYAFEEGDGSDRNEF